MDEYSQEELLTKFNGYVNDLSRECPEDSSLFVETAGGKRRGHPSTILSTEPDVLRAQGVHSPTLSALSQVDAYRPFLLPIILVGDSRLGGISSTISAYESLLLRGYTIDAVLLFQDDYYKNHAYLEQYFQALPKVHVDDYLGGGTIVASVPKPPNRVVEDQDADARNLEGYYSSLAGEVSAGVESNTIDGTKSQLGRVIEHLELRHAARLENLASMPHRTLSSVWWPFTQHASVKGESSVTVIDSAHEDFFVASGPNSFDERDPPAATSRSSLLATEFDGSASWWTQSAGHGRPDFTLAVAHAAGRYGHVIFPMATHAPALRLAERLLRPSLPSTASPSLPHLPAPDQAVSASNTSTAPGEGWASRVFFSDNGSTGIEVALKMAMRATALRYPASSASNSKRDFGVIGISGSYHGDTIGAMDASEGGVYNSAVEWHRERGFWFQPPQVGIRDGSASIVLPKDIEPIGSLSSRQGQDGYEVRFDGPAITGLQDIYDVSSRLDSPLAQIYREHISHKLSDLVRRGGHTFGALIIEPLVMGAGGMVFVDPLFQRVLIDEVRSRKDLASPSSSSSPSPPPPTVAAHQDEWRGLPVIFDEVFVGLYRLGFLSATSILGVNPDISVLAKILTGGVVPMGATLASESIFRTFLEEHKAQALLHGHSYTANPVACAVANSSLDFIEHVSQSKEWSSAKVAWADDRRSSPSDTVNAAAKPRPLTDGIWSLWDPQFVTEVSRCDDVAQVMSLGTVLAIQLRDSDAGEFSCKECQRPVYSLKETKTLSRLSSGIRRDIHETSSAKSQSSAANRHRSYETFLRVTLSTSWKRCLSDSEPEHSKENTE